MNNFEKVMVFLLALDPGEYILDVTDIEGSRIVSVYSDEALLEELTLTLTNTQGETAEDFIKNLKVKDDVPDDVPYYDEDTSYSIEPIYDPLDEIEEVDNNGE